MSNLSERLVKVADLMEQYADDPKTLKELTKEYKQISNTLYPKTSEHCLPAKEIKKSRKEALEKIKQYLDNEDIEGQFDDRSGDYYNSEKFLVSWNCNHNGFPHEISIDKVDSLYRGMSGAKCIVARRSLVSEEQLTAYSSFERALIDQGLKLYAAREEKKQFFEKYAVKYNERIINEVKNN
jgi:hypothetical protein